MSLSLAQRQRRVSGLRRATRDDLPAVTALQRAAYAKNRAILGVEPLPLMADYAKVFSDYEVYLAERDGALDGVLILEPRADDLLIWSVATAPQAQGRGVGNRMLAFAETARASARAHLPAPLHRRKAHREHRVVHAPRLRA